MNIVIFGAPGSGKGTQSERIIARYGLHHISTGDVLRDHIARGTELGKVANDFISKGQLIPDELMMEVLADIFRQKPEYLSEGVIFDGFPRTIAQADALAKLLKEYNTDIHAVVGLDVDEEELVRRLLLRGQSSGRSDDNIDTIKKRLNVYHSQTSPLRDYYTEIGTFNAINGNGELDRISADIFNVLDPIAAI